MEDGGRAFGTRREQAVRNQYVKVWIEPEISAEPLHEGDGPRVPVPEPGQPSAESLPGEEGLEEGPARRTGI